MRRLDELALQDTPIHRLNATAKLITTLLYLLVVTSFDRYEVTRLFPLILYPVFLISLGNLRVSQMAGRIAVILPLILFIGLFNPLFDRTPMLQIGSHVLSGGWVSFISITIRSLLAIFAALALIATTGIDSICAALLRLGLPRVLVVQLLFMYRYLYILVDETASILKAYSLRSPNLGGLHFRVWGSLLGQLLLRTLDRSQRIYQAMLCRGFDGNLHLSRSKVWTSVDSFYVISWLLFFGCVRLFDLPLLLGNILTGAFH